MVGHTRLFRSTSPGGSNSCVTCDGAVRQRAFCARNRTSHLLAGPIFVHEISISIVGVDRQIPIKFRGTRHTLVRHVEPRGGWHKPHTAAEVAVVWGSVLCRAFEPGPPAAGARVQTAQVIHLGLGHFAQAEVA
jgi:hypothetical protein